MDTLSGAGKNALADAAARVMIGMIDADDAAAQLNVTVPELMARTTDPGAVRRFYELREAGGVAAARAVSALEAAVSQISHLIEAGELPPTTLVKATEVLHRIAGVEEKRRVLNERQGKGGTGARVIINLIGRPPLVIRGSSAASCSGESPVIDGVSQRDEEDYHEPR